MPSERCGSHHVGEDLHAAVDAFDTIIGRILASAQSSATSANASDGGDAAPERRFAAEFEVRACIEELLQDHERTASRRHSQELARIRDHHTHIDSIRGRRAASVLREADKEKENRIQEAKQANWQKHAHDRDEVADAIRANEERASDLEVCKLRLDQEASRLEAQKAKIEQRERELTNARTRDEHKIAELQKEIETLRLAKQHMESDQAAMQAHRAQLGKAQRESSEKERKAMEQQKVLDSRQDEVVSAERALASKQEELSSRQTAVAERETSAARLSARETAVAEREKSAADLRKDLSSRESSLSHRDQSLREAEREMSAERHRLAVQAAELAENPRASADAARTDKEEALQARERQLTEKVTKLDVKFKQCSAREASLSEREAAVRLCEQESFTFQGRQGEPTAEAALSAQAQEDAERLRCSLARQEEELRGQRQKLEDLRVEDVRRAADLEARELRAAQRERGFREHEEAQADVDKRLAARGEQLAVREQQMQAAQRHLQVQQENRANFDRLVTQCTEAAAEDETGATSSTSSSLEAPHNAARLARRSAPPGKYSDRDDHEASSNVRPRHSEALPGIRRTRLTARKNIQGVADFITRDDGTSGSAPPSPGAKRGRASAPGLDAGAFWQDEAPVAKARAVAPPDGQASQKDASSWFSAPSKLLSTFSFGAKSDSSQA